MEEGADDDGDVLRWPKAGEFKWPKPEQASCDRARDLLTVMTDEVRWAALGLGEGEGEGEGLILTPHALRPSRLRALT